MPALCEVRHDDDITPAPSADVYFAETAKHVTPGGVLPFIDGFLPGASETPRARRGWHEVRSWVGGHARQLALRAGVLAYRFPVFEKTAP